MPHIKFFMMKLLYFALFWFVMPHVIFSWNSFTSIWFLILLVFRVRFSLFCLTLLCNVRFWFLMIAWQFVPHHTRWNANQYCYSGWFQTTSERPTHLCQTNAHLSNEYKWCFIKVKWMSRMHLLSCFGLECQIYFLIINLVHWTLLFCHLDLQYFEFSMIDLGVFCLVLVFMSHIGFSSWI